MSKQFTKVLALGLAAMMVLSGCGGTSTETKTPEESTAEKAGAAGRTAADWTGSYARIERSSYSENCDRRD